MSLETIDTTHVVEAELRHGAGCVRPRPIAFVRGEGAALHTADGERYIDASSSYGVASLGHAHPGLADVIAAQSRTLTALTPSYGNDVRASYLTELAAVLPEGLDRAFLCNSGTEAVEAALKIARLTTNRPGIVAANRGFHGRTMGALTATAEKKYRAPFEPLVPGIRHVTYGDAEALADAVDESTACVVLEVVQGEGGVRPADPEYLRAAREITESRGALLVFDEVQTGFGRTGDLFACEGVGVTPDVLALGKGIAGGLPMGATAFGERVGALPPGSHGSTFGGNPLACAAARFVLSEITAPGLLDGVVERGRQAFDRLASEDLRAVREVRGRGLMIGIELRSRVAPVMQELLERRVVALPAGPNVLRLLPPLNIDADDWRAVLDSVVEVLR